MAKQHFMSKCSKSDRPDVRADEPGQLSPGVQGAIEEQRNQLFKAQSVLRCLNAALADTDESLEYADAAMVVYELIDRAAAGLDPTALESSMRDNLTTD
jgi:hypothetical protein